MTTKKKKKFDEYAQAKTEISDRVKELAPNAGKDDPRRVLRYPVDGARNYELESDGTLWLCYSGLRVPHNRWTAREWAMFEKDTKEGLWDALAAFCK